MSHGLSGSGKGRACRVGSGNLLVRGEPCGVRTHLSELLRRLLDTLGAHMMDFLHGGGGQRVYWAQILWVSDWLGKGEVHSTRTHKQTALEQKDQILGRCGFFSAVAVAPGVRHASVEEGLRFTDGEKGPWAFRTGFSNYMTWFPCFGKGVECATQSQWQCAAGLKNNESILSAQLIKACDLRNINHSLHWAILSISKGDIC